MMSYLRLFATLALLITASGTRAQEEKSFSRQMNELKRSGDYVYAESSAPNEADAKAACDALLKIEITKYLVSTGTQSYDNSRIIRDISDYNREYLVQPRGDMVRVFGYVSKQYISSDAQPAPKKETVPPKETATIEIPAGPAMEAPTETTVAAAETAPKAATVTVATARPTSPAVRTAAVGLKTEGLDLLKWQIDMLENIVRKPDMAQAKKLLNRYKFQNRIKRLGNKSNPNPRPDDSFYLIYGDSGQPVALLAPSDTASHYDMLSGSNASLDNFTGNQYFWFQISN